MKILIIGGRGFLGSHLKKYLEGQITTLSRSKSSSKNHLSVDIFDLDKIKKIIPKYDVIINCFGLTPIKQPKKITYSQAHVVAVRNILFSLKPNQRFIHISALGANSDSKNEYLRTKGKAEEIIKSSKSNYLIIRPSMIFEKDCELFLSTKKTPFFPNISAKIAPVHPKDICLAILKNQNQNKVLELAGPQIMSIFKFIKDYKKANNEFLFKIYKPFFIPIFYVMCKLRLFGLSNNQWSLLKIDNISSNPWPHNYIKYDEWLSKIKV